jgi:hypothetical protein
MEIHPGFCLKGTIETQHIKIEAMRTGNFEEKTSILVFFPQSDIKWVV